MPSVKVDDKALKEAFQKLAAAQASDDDKDAAAASKHVAEKTDEAERKDAKSSQRQSFWVNLLSAIAGGIIVLLLLWHFNATSGAEKDTRRALCWAALAIYLLYGLLGVFRWTDGGLLSYLRGKDGRLGTTLLQVGLWTVAVSSALVYFIFLAFYSPDATETFKKALGGDNLPDEYLLLLGGNCAAGRRRSVHGHVEGRGRGDPEGRGTREDPGRRRRRRRASQPGRCSVPGFQSRRADVVRRRARRNPHSAAVRLETSSLA